LPLLTGKSGFSTAFCVPLEAPPHPKADGTGSSVLNCPNMARDRKKAVSPCVYQGGKPFSKAPLHPLQVLLAMICVIYHMTGRSDATTSTIGGCLCQQGERKGAGRVQQAADSGFSLGGGC
jgi:hypothetical protein